VDKRASDTPRSQARSTVRALFSFRPPSLTPTQQPLTRVTSVHTLMSDRHSLARRKDKGTEHAPDALDGGGVSTVPSGEQSPQARAESEQPEAALAGHPDAERGRESEAESARRKELDVAMYYFVRRIADEQRVQLSAEACSAVALLSAARMETLAGDLQAFATHAKRTQMNVDDVKLASRHSATLVGGSVFL
jgi:histone H3/H4